MEQRTSLAEIIEYIDPGSLSYQEWCSVGMALKLEGYPISVWDQWSKKDFSRYHAGECERKWKSFSGSSSPVTGGTIVQMAIEHGWVPERGHELDWNDSIQIDSDRVVVDKNWLEGKEIHEPENWNPAEQLITYLETLFEAGENVGYVTGSWEKTDEKGTRWLPQKGSWDRTAGQLIEQLNSCNGDIGSVLGDYNPKAGAWIRFNPLDGNGCKNENVTEYRYALVESDHMDIEQQNAILRELELPIACLVYSGKKSLHAIVRVDAADYSEYRKRVDYLYEVCQKNGIDVDTQNRNPSRLSRMPGVQRGEKKQFIVDTNLGKASWNEWYEWIEGVNDDLPEPEGLESVWDNLPELSPCLIEGVLRKGHKMLIAGPSKAGKSFLQIELCIAIAEGKKWLQWHCAQGRVMYVNLELDRASCLHRFKDVYTSMGIAPENLQNIDIWNLRGKSVPMDKLAPKLIRRAAKKDYVTIIIDPIYKVITGDENSADQMANFCNQFDKVCTELGCAVIYCHHHSKGSQGGNLLQNPTPDNKTVRHAIITGECGAQGHFAKNSRMQLPKKWLDKFGGYENENEGTHYGKPDPEIKVSKECCYWLKEKPCDDWAKQHNSAPYLGMMASEGGQREEALIEHGCNYYGKTVIRSAPFAIFLRQDILLLAMAMDQWYHNHLDYFERKFHEQPYGRNKDGSLKEYVPVDSIIPAIYGVIEENDIGVLRTTGAQRTGCEMCGFGIHLEQRPHRFDRLRERNPKAWEFWMYRCCTDPETGEKYGWGRVLDYIGVEWEDIPPVQMTIFDYPEVLP